ncbi:MAG: tRNA (adenosine(37)-N6)-threonylcarbamoyltransferase complex dimerization subunit type 1 TsaB [Propionibacteriaceae bacterium]|jgi:tRNA threonylcarbamoyl adenosine modification protein YeaZ|nr:tRNA (adenosine(37)-N6)-threonylcarbamoyltransferase complex dimerization subunit type 1 TsaB [Propionibacteriaceae bacterium]
MVNRILLAERRVQSFEVLSDVTQLAHLQDVSQEPAHILSSDQRYNGNQRSFSDAWVLGIDTSTVVNTGLARNGQLLVSRHVGDSMNHVELLAKSVTAVLADCEVRYAALSAIGVGVGPGPFTGLRVGIAAAETLGFALGIPVIGVCSLDVLAAQYADFGAESAFVVTVDARRKELYWAEYDMFGRRVGDPQVGAPDTLPDLPVLGPGVALYPELLGSRALFGAPSDLDAGFLAARLAILPHLNLTPLYLREPDAALPNRRKSVLANTLRASKSDVAHQEVVE